MMSSFSTWFGALSSREKILIGILGILAAGMVGYYAILSPFRAALDSAEARYGEAVEQRARIESKILALEQPGAATVKPLSGPLDVFISQQAGEAGFAVGRLDPQADNRVNLVIDSARPTALFGWLARLEAKGVSAEQLVVSPASGGTVTATMTLRTSAPGT